MQQQQQEEPNELPSTSGQQDLAQGRPACYVITHSVSKKHNIGTIARCATAFGVKEVSMRLHQLEVCFRRTLHTPLPAHVTQLQEARKTKASLD